MHGYDTNATESKYPPPLINNFDNSYGEIEERSHIECGEPLNTLMNTDNNYEYKILS